MIRRQIQRTFSSMSTSGSLILSRSEELICKNLMCENVTLPCVCKLERLLQGLGANDLETLDLSYNNLTTLPPSLSKMKGLQTLHLQGNKFSNFPLSSLEPLDSLKYLDVSENPCVIEDNAGKLDGDLDKDTSQNSWHSKILPSLPTHLQKAIFAAKSSKKK